MPPMLKDRKHTKSLSEALEEDEPRKKALKGNINKRATLVKATDEGIVQEPGATMRPTDEQLSEINKFTRKTVTADEVVAFTTLSCNDMPDRDDDQFTTDCVKDFAELEQPFSSVGKGFMLDHQYSVNNAAGRIFGVDTKKISGSLFLTNEVYIPNTESNQKLIEDIDFGVNWAVSVGVVLGKDECSVCNDPFSSWGWWCVNGHDKGMSYDPKSEETDSWGYPVPCDPDQKGAIKCLRKFSEPRDYYELSQVFLGAQYFAALEKQPDFAQVMKSVTSAKVPIIGLSEAEAEGIPLRHEPKRVSDARLSFGVTELDDGSLKWVDGQGLQWTYDPANPEDGVLSLGKLATKETGEEEDDGEEEHDGAPGSDDREVAGEGESDVDQSHAEGREGVEGDSSAASGEQPSRKSGAEVADDEDSDEEDEDSDEDSDDDSDSEDDDDSDEDDDTNKTASVEEVLRAAERAKLPATVIDRIRQSNKDGVSSLAVAVALEIKSLEQKVSELTPKAEIGEQYITHLRADAVHWYTISRQSKAGEAINTETFEKLLDRVGDSVDILKGLIDEHKAEAQKKFPKVRRSSFPKDPNEAEAPTPVELEEDEDVSGRKVTRLHSTGRHSK